MVAHVRCWWNRRSDRDAGEWRWIGHTLCKPVYSTTWQALSWNSEGKRIRGQMRNTWCCNLEADVWETGYTWNWEIGSGPEYLEESCCRPMPQKGRRSLWLIDWTAFHQPYSFAGCFFERFQSCCCKPNVWVINRSDVVAWIRHLFLCKNAFVKLNRSTLSCRHLPSLCRHINRLS